MIEAVDALAIAVPLLCIHAPLVAPLWHSQTLVQRTDLDSHRLTRVDAVWKI